jgi:hypothetical protein
MSVPVDMDADGQQPTPVSHSEDKRRRARVFVNVTILQGHRASRAFMGRLLGPASGPRRTSAGSTADPSMARHPEAAHRGDDPGEAALRLTQASACRAALGESVLRAERPGWASPAISVRPTRSGRRSCSRAP